ncbi:MAG: saccharopine dehydrogenase NADP-binding domain-containing protein [Chromatiales bacterium]|jgi:short subunit dehydrogenase-like uncharacterized protein
MGANKLLIYGANGYSGAMIAQAARERGLEPVVAGRRKESVEKVGRELDLPVRVFALDAADALAEELRGFDVLLNCAGPFSATAQPMMQACVAAGAHYLDITGEISVFVAAQAMGEQAAAAGVVLCPGVGFDVVPTDCLAARLKEALPDANKLALGFDSRSGMSPGTAKTSVEGLAQGGRVRRGGKIVAVPLAYRTRRIDFGDGEKLAMTIPWGDVATAYFSTGIADIDVYIPASPRLVSRLKKMNWVRPLLGVGIVQDFMKKRIERSVKGPTPEQRERLSTSLWGEVQNPAGEVRAARYTTANGYTVTVDAAVRIAEHLLDNQGASGYLTPSQLMGANFAFELPGSSELTWL